MGSGNRRLDKLESNLTPKQAALLWMAEAHNFDTPEGYALHMKNQPHSAWPLRRLGDQMRVSVEQSRKGKPAVGIDLALRRAYLDVAFLYHLHEGINSRLAEKERYFSTYSLLLVQQLNALVRERIINDQALWNRMMVALNMPYPLVPETADAVDAAIQNHVIPWEALEESDDVAGWVTYSFVAEGKTELPEGAYRLQSNYTGSLTPPDPDEVGALFSDPENLGKFLSGEDYSNGLADVTNAEFSAHYETIVSAMKNLGWDGLMVELPTVPHAFLREAPLVEGEWIDRYVVTLAEWGARLAQQGLVVVESDDPHPLAWFRITNPEDGTEASNDRTNKLWQQTQKHLDRYPGRNREIDGRKYLNWEDYLGWRGRRVKGDLKSGLTQGLVFSQWNRWVEEQDGESKATLAGTPVAKLGCHAEACQFHEGAQGLDLERRQRQSLLESLWLNRPGSKAEERFFEQVRHWKELAHDFLLELYTLRRVINSVNQLYYEGQQALFPQVAQGFEELVGYIERLVDLYNRDLAEELDRLIALMPEGDSPQSVEPFSLDASILEGLTEKQAEPDAAYLVDMAKVEALDTMGENQKAVELLERHV